MTPARGAFVLGVGMLRFGRMLDRGIKSLAQEAVGLALADAGVDARLLEAVWFANSGWGMGGGQDCIRGQVALRPIGIAGLPIVNVENACAGGSTALHGAWLDVASGAHECVLAIGVEKLLQKSRLRTFASFLGGLDVEELPSLMAKARELGAPNPAQEARAPAERDRATRRRSARELGAMLLDAVVLADHYRLDVPGMARRALLDRVRDARRRDGSGSGRARSPFMDLYAIGARRHMERWGTTARQLAVIASKNHGHGSLNPLAQVRRAMTVDEVLADALVAAPLTRAMCAPIGDGAAAAIVCSERFARAHGWQRAARIRASVLASSARGAEDDDAPGITERASRRAYELAALGPDAIQVAEVHDATAFGELHQSEALGFCPPGGGGELAASGATMLGGRIPLNTSGGLESRGHPIAASGLAQIHEIVTQLRGRADGRQVAGARIGLAQNGGGFLGGEEAAMVIHLLEAPAR